MNKILTLTNYYVTHRDELLAYVSSRLGNSVEAEDLVQNVFLRLLTSDRMITEVTLPALVYTIARNLITDFYRRRTHFDDYEHYLKNTDSIEESAESILSIRDITEQLERGLTHMGMRAYDRIPVVRYNKDYMLPALYEAGKTYADRLENGFDMYY